MTAILPSGNQDEMVINFVDYSLNQGAPARHESAETPIGHESNGAVAGESNPESNGAVATATARDESNGAVAGDRTPNQMVPLPLLLLGTNQMAPLPGMVPLYSDITFSEYLHVDYD
uniref:Uncharacterized protein n=1 Tax=Vitis vinifera TaxID=29760 RepID=A5B3E6_VITVI|nr:hypothetical protein VITISV_023225 [Vitis vinifera]